MSFDRRCGILVKLVAYWLVFASIANKPTAGRGDFPNLRAALKGIDVPSLNPLPDKGERTDSKFQIFQHPPTDFTQNDQFDYLEVVEDLGCFSKYEKKVFDSFDELTEGYTKLQTKGYGINIDISAPVNAIAKYYTGGLAPTIPIPPVFSRSSSNRDEVERTKFFLDKQKGSIAHSRAECSIYNVKVNIKSPSLRLFSGFETALLEMDKVGRRNATLLERKEHGRQFIEDYGTHFATDTTMGMSRSFETRFDNEETKKLSKEERESCSTLEGARFFGWQVEEDKNECTNNLKDDKDNDNSILRRNEQRTIGSFPEGNLDEWSDQLQEMKKSGELSPVPIKRAMSPIYELLESNAIKNLQHDEGSLKGQNVDLFKLKQLLFEAYDDYCNWGPNCTLSCPEIVSFFDGNKSHSLSKQTFPINGKAHYCPEGSGKNCIYYFQGAWYFGSELGGPDNAVFKTVGCPQVGSEFVGKIELPRSPIRTNNYLECARICQQKHECSFWQFKRRNRQCSLVKQFSESKPNKNSIVVTGARNCPIVNKSFVNQCPSHQASSRMWQKISKTKDAYFDPKIEIEHLCGGITMGTCFNNGICEKVGNDHKCKCEGFKGTYCEEDLDECELSNPCKNGGVCQNEIGSYTCRCNKNHEGINCELEKQCPRPAGNHCQVWNKDGKKNCDLCMCKENPPIVAASPFVCPFYVGKTKETHIKNLTVLEESDAFEANVNYIGMVLWDKWGSSRYYFDGKVLTSGSVLIKKSYNVLHLNEAGLLDHDKLIQSVFPRSNVDIAISNGLRFSSFFYKPCEENSYDWLDETLTSGGFIWKTPWSVQYSQSEHVPHIEKEPIRRVVQQFWDNGKDTLCLVNINATKCLNECSMNGVCNLSSMECDCNSKFTGCDCSIPLNQNDYYTDDEQDYNQTDDFSHYFYD